MKQSRPTDPMLDAETAHPTLDVEPSSLLGYLGGESSVEDLDDLRPVEELLHVLQSVLVPAVVGLSRKKEGGGEGEGEEGGKG